MKSREEKRHKFHETLLNTLHPPQSQLDKIKPPSIIASASTQEKDDFDVNLIPDDYGLQEESSSSKSDDKGDSEGGQQKLTRAQRKRLRKKKLKEDMSRRRHVIGPLLPSSSNDSDGGSVNAVEEDIPTVRQNADESHGRENSQRKKLKQRRLAKRLAREKLIIKPCNAENCVEDSNLES